jgi:hypothetical protein
MLIWALLFREDQLAALREMSTYQDLEKKIDKRSKKWISHKYLEQ